MCLPLVAEGSHTKMGCIYLRRDSFCWPLLSSRDLSVYHRGGKLLVEKKSLVERCLAKTE